MTRRIAMWSGPRNISTALMRSWENRADCEVIDEPFYAFYLKRTGLDHPGREQILAAQSSQWEEVAQQLCGPPPGSAEIWYQKHMTHHLLDDISREWMTTLTHAFLIREPAAVLSSYLRSREEVCLEDLGFVQQARLFEWLREQTGQIPVVVESSDILKNPERMLQELCRALEVPFDSDMLQWPPGVRDSDGVWAPHWYTNVERSTGFHPYRPPQIQIPDSLQFIVEEAAPYYQALAEHRISP